MNILYVEDDPKEAELTSRRLTGSESQFRMDVVHTRREAIERLSLPEATQYDLVLTDLRLPDGDGLAVLTHLRERALPVAVVVIVNAADESTVASVLQAGADDCVDKGPGFLSRLPLALNVALTRFRSQAVLREGLERYHSLFDGVPMGIYRNTPDGQILDANPMLVQMLGYADRDSLLGINAADTYVDTEDRVRWKALLERDGVVRNFEKQLRRRDGSIIWVEENARAVRQSDGQVLFYEGSFQDITDRKRAEAELRESEEKYRLVVENASDAILIAQQGMLTFVNPRAVELTGYREDALTSRPFVDFIHPDDREMVLNRHIRRLRGEELPRAYPFRIVREDRGVRWVEIHAVPILWGGKPATLNFLDDITDRRRAEQDLRASEANYRAIFNAANDAIFVHDIDSGDILDLNQKGCEMYGYTVEEVRRLNVEDISAGVPPFTQKEVLQWIARAIQGEPQLFEWQAKDKAGKQFWVEVGLKRAVIEGKDRLLAVVRGITERKRLEAQFLQSQKMEAVGRLAGGVAHDFNNSLTSIIGLADLVLMRLSQDDSLRQDVEEIKKAGIRAASLTSQLLAFSRKQILQPMILDLNMVMMEMESMLARLIGEDIQLKMVPAPSLWKVKADPGQIQQVIMNLAVNARDAMPRGGKLAIETANEEIHDSYAGQHAVPMQPGSYVRFTVSDTGVGMDEETKSHIFEPFFTTKGLGKGTGLGLATVYGIVKQSGGYIWVSSKPGMGTTFEIFLPRVDGPEASVGVRTAFQAELSGSETVLVVEDDDMVRHLARDILARYGYTVLESPNGEEALQVMKGHPGPIHLLLTDVVMPGLSGPEVAERVRLSRPEVKVLYMSGYTDDAIVHHGALDPGTAFLQKPFTSEVLARKLKQVLHPVID